MLWVELAAAGRVRLSAAKLDEEWSVLDFEWEEPALVDLELLD